MSLLLTVRRSALEVLNAGNARRREAAHEYDFLLACYGLHAGRFANQSDSERAAAFAAAGAAAARCRPPVAAPAAGDEAAARERYADYREPLRVAHRWNRGGDPAQLSQAQDLLARLCARHPHGIQVWYERAFGLVRLGRRAEALVLLRRVCELFRNALDEDTFALWGRCLKDEADERLAEALAPGAGAGARLARLDEADRFYQQAIAQYQLAHALHGHWFPGINVATLTFVRAALARQLGRPEESETLRATAAGQARQLAEAGRWRERLADDDVWAWATRGEARLLRQEWAEAEAGYQSALRQANCGPHHRDSMKAQVKRILTAGRLLGVEPRGPLADPDAFFAPPEPPPGAPP